MGRKIETLVTKSNQFINFFFSLFTMTDFRLYLVNIVSSICNKKNAKINESTTTYHQIVFAKDLSYFLDTYTEHFLRYE